MDEPADSKLSVEFRTQIERLRSKLEQIAGPAALAAFDEQRASGTLQGGSGGQSPLVGGNRFGALPGRMTNEQLCHEMILDPTFQLDEEGGSRGESRAFRSISESFHRVSAWLGLGVSMALGASQAIGLRP